MAVAIIREVLGSIVHTCPMSPVPTAHREAHTELALQPGTGPHLFTDMTDKLQHCAQGLKGTRGQRHRTNSHPPQIPDPTVPPSRGPGPICLPHCVHCLCARRSTLTRPAGPCARQHLRRTGQGTAASQRLSTALPPGCGLRSGSQPWSQEIHSSGDGPPE